MPEGERAAWTAALEEALLAAGIQLPEEPPHPVPRVSVTVSVASGEGRTDTGTRFLAARATAVIGLRRVRIEVVSHPGVAADAAGARRKALESLVPRVESAIAW